MVKNMSSTKKRLNYPLPLRSYINNSNITSFLQCFYNRILFLYISCLRFAKYWKVAKRTHYTSCSNKLTLLVIEPCANTHSVAFAIASNQFFADI